MAITHTFKSSRSSGVYAYIEDDQLVIGEDGPREGGIIYRGNYEGAKKYLAKLNATRTYNDIEKYFNKHDPNVVLRSSNNIWVSDLKPGDKFKYKGCTYFTLDFIPFKCLSESYIAAVNLISHQLELIMKCSIVELIK